MLNKYMRMGVNTSDICSIINVMGMVYFTIEMAGTTMADGRIT